MKLINLFIIFATFFISLQHIIDGCKTPNTPQEIKESVICIADKSLKLMLSAKGATGGNSFFFPSLKRALRNYNIHLSLIQKVMEAKDNSAEKIKGFLNDETVLLSVPSISKMLTSSLINAGHRLLHMIEDFDSYDHDDIIDLATSLFSPELCAAIKQLIGLDICQSIPCMIECGSPYDKADSEDDDKDMECMLKCI